MTNVTKKKNKNNFIVQGGILAFAGILVRLIGLLKRIPLTNIIGDEGNGFYAAAYETYSIILLISSYSLPLAVSKLVSARVGKGQFKNARKIYKGALLFAIISGGVASVLVFVFADFIAGTLMLEPMSALALKVLAPALLIVAIMGVFRGYFQGLGTMMPTAVSQIVEQIFVVIASLAGASVLFDYGVKVGSLLHNDLYGAAYGAAGGTLGPGVGALIGLFFLLFVFSAYQPKLKRQIKRDATRVEESYSQIFTILLMTIVPVILSTVVYNISSVLDQRIYNQVMISKGLEEIKSYNWGVFTGKYKTLINIPIALASAMCASTVPTITKAMSRGESKLVKEKVSNVVRVTMMISIPCAVGLAILGRPVVDMLFSGEIDMAAKMLHVGTVSIVFYSLSTLTNGILQGINQMKIPVRNAFIALVVHLGALYVMLEFMDLNIYAVVYANVIFSFLMCILNGLAISKHLKYRQEKVKTFAIPLLCATVMGVIVFISYRLLSMAMGTNLAGEIVSVLVSTGIGVIVYFVLLVAFRGVTERELSAVPFGRVLVKVLKAIRILP